MDVLVQLLIYKMHVKFWWKTSIFVVKTQLSENISFSILKRNGGKMHHNNEAKCTITTGQNAPQQRGKMHRQEAVSASCQQMRQGFPLVTNRCATVH